MPYILTNNQKEFIYYNYENLFDISQILKICSNFYKKKNFDYYYVSWSKDEFLVLNTMFGTTNITRQSYYLFSQYLSPIKFYLNPVYITLIDSKQILKLEKYQIEILIQIWEIDKVKNTGLDLAIKIIKDNYKEIFNNKLIKDIVA